MKKSILFVAIALVLTSFMACGSKNNKPDGTEGWVETPIRETGDSTIYGLCGVATSMNTLQMITDNGDTLMLSTEIAQEDGRVFGGYKVGDRLAVLADLKVMRATMVINQSLLMGNWVMPNPMDGSSEMGISIKDGGIAESINQSSIVYKTWRLNNGVLEIVNVREDAGNFEEKETFELLYLSSDSLSYRDRETIYEYKHPSDVDPYAGFNVDLEEGSFDDFVM